MTEPVVFEINDAGLTLTRGDLVLAREPGLALVQSRRLVFGQEAFAESRLLPRDVVDRFWWRLSQEPITLAHARVRSFADLAYFQVQALTERLGLAGDALLAVHGGYDADQLGLLLGLMQPQKLRAVGLVDSAVAAVSVTAGAGRYRHLDLTRHGVIVTDVEVGDEARRLDTRQVAEVGLNVLTETAAEAAAAAFLDQTRFDPMLDGAAEQALHDSLGGWLTALSTASEVDAEVRYRGHAYRARLTRQLVSEPLARVLTPLAALRDEDAPLLVSERLAAWPGLEAVLGEVHRVPEAAVAAACRRHAERIVAEPPALPLITALPADAGAAPIHRAARRGSGGRRAASEPSHLLVDAQAYALGATPLYLVGAGEVRRARDGAAAAIHLADAGAEITALAAGVRVNGRSVTGSEPVAAGDVVTAGAATGRLIRVAEPAD